MRNSIGFIAIGQAGGNIGMLFEKHGYNVLFINTSEEDLSTLNNSNFKYHIKGGEGCNKDRNKAKDLIISNYDELYQEIIGKMKEEFIFVIFSSGGGTGSGVSPMLIDLLSQNLKDRSIGAITILPSETEALKAHMNSYECLKELADIENIGSTFVLDNNKEEKLVINRIFVELFNSMIDMVNRKDIRGNIDRAEIKEMLRTRGNIMVTKVRRTENLTAQLINSFSKNIFAPMEKDKVIKYMGLSSAGKINFESIKREIGNFLDLFQGYNKEDTVCVLSGLTLPFTRLIDIKDKVKANQDEVKKNLQATKHNRLDEDIDFLENVDNSKSTKSSSNDIFAKYRKK